MKISVALCTYNGEKFLSKQLDSILKQTVPVDEIVVCDDISNDNTKTILEDYNNRYPNLFHIHINETNLGSNNNFEKAIKLTTGDYIFLADQDDLWKTDKVAKILKVFEENPTAEGVFSDADLIDDNDQLLYKNMSLWDSVNFYERFIPKPIDLYKILLHKGNYLTGATLCIKKEVKEFCFPFKTLDKVFLHDEWFAFLLSDRKTLYYSTKKLISYRLHSNQQMGVGSIKDSKFKNTEELTRGLSLILNTKQPETFKDFKIITRTLFQQYKKFKQLNDKYNFLDETVHKDILRLYIDADSEMKKKHPIQYYFRKKKDKKKGKRQL